MTCTCFRRFVTSALLFASLTASAVVGATVKFDIPAQPAPDALKAFIRQSNAEVTYRSADLEQVVTNEVKGDMEPAMALDAMLGGTGFVASRRDSGIFVVKRAEAASGSVEGAVRDESGKPVAAARVALAGSEQVATTDRRGRFRLVNIPAGTHELQVSAEGMQNTRVTDVSVQAGHRLTLSTITLPVKSASLVQFSEHVVSAKKNDGVVELDPFSVEGRREKPFVDGNLDIPRTIDDVQSYYIFDAKAIGQSGATNVEDFLKQRLTMNAGAYSSSQNFSDSQRGNRSSVNLRGLGSNSTLVLVNGRRVAGAYLDTRELQPDLNGIPLSAIERVEVLPTSASGIYGSGAIGGVVNVVLKRNYRGGEIRLSYDSPLDVDAPRRSVSASFGTTLEDGKTRLNLSATWSDSQPLLLQDRFDIISRYRDTLQTNRPGHLFSLTSPRLGALPNIMPTSTAQTTLTLRNGTVINSRQTFVAGGTSPNTPPSELYSMLAANGGQQNTEYPPTNQSVGRLIALGAFPKNKSFIASVRRQMLPRVEAYAEFSYNANTSTRSVNFGSNSFVVPVTAPTNPFTTAVRVRVPYQVESPNSVESGSRMLSVGASVDLPANWTSVLDYTASQSRASYFYTTTDTTAITADLASGALNPFVDTLQYPLDMAKYHISNRYRGTTEMHNVSLRAAGPLPALPWGQPRLTSGIERRMVSLRDRVQQTTAPLTVGSNSLIRYFPRNFTTDAGYAEVTIPLVKENRFTGLHALELQASGRREQFQVETGTISVITNPANPASLPSFTGVTRNGQPFTDEDEYSTHNYTIGFKYEPWAGFTIRASRSTAFIPPTPEQLTENPTISTFTTDITDPLTGQLASPFTRGGGNTGLKPQNSVSHNVGVIWEPRWRALAGLRLNVEYYQTEQMDYITNPSAQFVVNNANFYPGRVTRNASNEITLVDVSAINLYRLENAGWDLSASYRRGTPWGEFGLSTTHSFIEHAKTQFSPTLPMYDAVGFPSEEGAARYKSNATATLDRGPWTLGWTVRYFSEYNQFGAPGGPHHTQATSTGSFLDTSWVTAQGSTRIPSQIYHDAFATYDMDRRSGRSESERRRTWAGSLMHGWSIQVGVRNIFNKVPPMDAYYAGNAYFSPYGDVRLRSYWLNLRKSF